MPCQVEIILHSRVPETGAQIYTIAVRYWRAIHGEVLTHRRLSRNSSSSRAIPVRRVLEQVIHDPAGPIHWGAQQPGMQADNQLAGWRLRVAKGFWTFHRFASIFASWGMMRAGLHKQVANRVTEPHQYIKVLITSTEWDNFFLLRDHGDAQPEIQELARAIKAAMAKSEPQLLRPGEWHIPFVKGAEYESMELEELIHISTARNARVSYLTHDLKPTKPEADIELHDDLVGSEPIHASPAEHVAVALDDLRIDKNFRGFKQYRSFVESGDTRAGTVWKWARGTYKKGQRPPHL